MAHVSKHGRKKVPVCKFWLAKRCREGSLCQFHHAPNPQVTPKLHGDVMGQKPPLRNAAASNRSQMCPRYHQGFCYLGPLCELIHVPGHLCQRYLIGFCPHGSSCTFSHPKFGKPRHAINHGEEHQEEIPTRHLENLLCVIQWYRLART